MQLPSNPSPLDAATRDACVSHARQMLADQLPAVQAAGFDFMPPFVETTTQLYLLGVMRRCLQDHASGPQAREQAYTCLHHMFQQDGREGPDARLRIAQLRAVATTDDGLDVQAVRAGHEARTGDRSLLALFEPHRSRVEVAGAPYRFFVAVKRASAIGTVAGMLAAGFIARLVSDDAPVIIGTGFIAGIAIGITILGIGLSSHRKMLAAKAA